MVRGRTRSTRTRSDTCTGSSPWIASRIASISPESWRIASRACLVNAIGCSTGTIADSSASLSTRRALCTARSTPASSAVLISSCTRSRLIRRSVANAVPSLGSAAAGCRPDPRRIAVAVMPRWVTRLRCSRFGDLATAAPAGGGRLTSGSAGDPVHTPARWRPARTGRRPAAVGIAPRSPRSPSTAATGAGPPVPATVPGTVAISLRIRISR